MKWVKWLLFAVAALLLLFAAVGVALPSQFTIEGSVATATPAGKPHSPIEPQRGWVSAGHSGVRA